MTKKESKSSPPLAPNSHDPEGDDDHPYHEDTGVFDVGVESGGPQLDSSRLIAGRYEIIDRIGSGGMGQVVHVRHTRLGKSFAIKLMQAENTFDPGAIALFRAEARLASSLCHPNIVSVVDFGDDPDWGFFIAMEYLKGDALSDRIKATGALPVDVACEVGIQIASAIAHSHEHHIVHSDVKAENVLCITEGESPWHVKLLDFGTAQLANRAGRDERISGTPEYMSPERILGNPPAPSNDIYAIGIILYEMLTGRVPFVGNEVGEILRQHLDCPLESAGARRGEVLDPAFDEILSRALAKKPEERYESAGELAEALRAYSLAKGARQRAAEQRVGLVEHTREEAAADAFDALGVAAASLHSNGTIGVANRAFVKFMRASSRDEIEGRMILETPLARLHPGIREDLRLVAMKGKLIHRRLAIRLKAGNDLEIRLTMSPAHGRAGSCMLLMHALPRSSSE